MGELKEPTEKREAEGEGTKYIERMRALQNHAEEPWGKRKQMEKFKVGDKVSYTYHGLGTVIANHNDGRPYPIDVKWDKSNKGHEVSTFTKDGFLVVSLGDLGDNDKLTVVGKAGEDINKFKVGDKVRSREFGVGVVDEVLAPEYPYPITIKWTEDGTYSTFTLEGHYYPRRADAEKDITLLEGEDKAETDAINPAHYRVEGIPEAIEIMQGLMTKEQFEGFLWGNILKYAYRYGRKGDKKETAGKIAWYAKKLEELEKEEKK